MSDHAYKVTRESTLQTQPVALLISHQNEKHDGVIPI